MEQRQAPPDVSRLAAHIVRADQSMALRAARALREASEAAPEGGGAPPSPSPPSAAASPVRVIPAGSAEASALLPALRLASAQLARLAAAPAAASPQAARAPPTDAGFERAARPASARRLVMGQTEHAATVNRLVSAMEQGGGEGAGRADAAAASKARKTAEAEQLAAENAEMREMIANTGAATDNTL